MYYILILLILISARISAAPFPDLHKKEFKLPAKAQVTDLNRTYLSFNPKHFTEINKNRHQLPKDNPLYIADTEAVAADELVLGIIDLTGKGDTYYLTLSDFPSYDIAYNFYKNKNAALTAKPEFLPADFLIAAPSIIIPGNGFIYSYGHNNNSYSIKNKYTFSAGKVTPLSQPFKYLGAAAKSLKEQTIYTDMTLNTALYKISTGSPVTIVGLYEDADKKKEYFLVASEFGLIGYIENERSQSQTQFSGFYFNGD